MKANQAKGGHLHKDPMAAAFDLISAVAENPGQFPNEFVAFRRGSPELLKILSGEPCRILDYLESDKGSNPNLTSLAAALHRDLGAVSRDVKVLVEAGLVAEKKVGREKKLEATHRMVLVQ